MRVEPNVVKEPTPRIVMAREELPEVRTRAEIRDDLGTDLIRWGSIWGGFFSFLAIATILGAIAIAAGGIPATVTPAVGVTVALILLVSTFASALLAGWTSNIRRAGPALVNGVVFAAVITSLPLLLATAAAGVALAPGGPVDFTTPALNMIRANLLVFSLGTILMLAVGALGYFSGMKAHLRDLNRLHLRRARH